MVELWAEHIRLTSIIPVSAGTFSQFRPVSAGTEKMGFGAPLIILMFPSISGMIRGKDCFGLELRGTFECWALLLATVCSEKNLDRQSNEIVLLMH